MTERYKIYEKLGSGGVGAVFRAYDSELKRWVAIKRLLTATEASGDAGTAAELRREADALASLRNPNIVTIFDVANDAEGLFMVMELLEGEDLADVVSRGPLHYDDFKELASQTLEALLAAHQRHILHRDIKPENIKVERLPGGRMQSKIIDFGLARSGLRARKQTEDQEGTVMGSIYYMAPEQLTREPVDERTDLYALGCVFYEALSGRKAFDGDSMNAVIDAHINHDIVPLHVVAPHVPPWLGAWVLRLMANKTEDRPANAQQAIEEFRAWEKLAAAPAMMPWMPMGYGTYTAPQLAPGAETMPLHGYYQQPAPVAPAAEEPVFYAQPVVDDEPVIEIAAQTSPLTRPRPITGRGPVTGRQTGGVRGTGPIKSGGSPRSTGPVHGASSLKRSDRDDTPAKSNKNMIVAGVAVVVVGLGAWFLFGRGGKRSDSGGSASDSVLASGPPPVSFELPADRAFPPVSDDIALHLVSPVGANTGRKDATGKLANAAVNEPIVEWHDIAPLGNDNLLRSFEANPSHGPKRGFLRAAAAGAAGVKPTRSGIDFRIRNGKATALNLTDLEGQATQFPFGPGPFKNEKGLTLALVFQMDADRLPSRVLAISGEGDVSVTLTVDTKKNLTAEFKNGSLTKKVTSKDVDTSAGCIATITWNGAGATELRLRDAMGKAFQTAGPKVTPPAEPLVHLQIGKVQDDAGKPASPAEQFSGLASELIVYSSVLKTDQLQLLEGSLRSYYFQTATAAPKASAPSKK